MAQSGPVNHKSRDSVNETGRKSVDNSPSTVSWLKESILGLPRRLIGSLPQEKDGPFREDFDSVTELKVVADSEWLVVDSPEEQRRNMSSSAAATASEQDHHHGSHASASGSNKKARNYTAGHASKPQLSVSSSTPPTGRTSSMSSKNKPPRPGSPHTTTTSNSVPLQRKISGRGSRATNQLEVQNGGATQRSTSPNRVRHPSPSRGSGRTDSPISGSRSSLKKKGVLQVQT